MQAFVIASAMITKEQSESWCLVIPASRIPCGYVDLMWISYFETWPRNGGKIKSGPEKSHHLDSLRRFSQLEIAIWFVSKPPLTPESGSNLTAWQACPALPIHNSFTSRIGKSRDCRSYHAFVCFREFLNKSNPSSFQNKIEKIGS